MAVLLVGLLFAGFIFELGVRLTLGEEIILFPRFHAAVTYGDFTIRRLRPNAKFQHRSRDGRWQFRINAQGFRADRDYVYEKSNGVFRVIALGDSHTQGFEVRQNETYAAVMERYLTEHLGIAEVINAGVSGFGNAEELIFVEQEGYRYQPDAIVVGFFANDFDDNLNADLFRLEDGMLVTNKLVYVPAGKVLDFIDGSFVLRWLSQHSYAYSHLFNNIWNWKKYLLFQNAEYAVKQTDASREVTRAKEELTVALLKRLYSFCHARGIVLVVLDIPQLPDGMERIQSSVPRELIPVIEQNCDLFVNGTALLSDYGVAEIFVPHGQRHISATTHRVLGIATAKALVERNDNTPAVAPDLQQP